MQNVGHTLAGEGLQIVHLHVVCDSVDADMRKEVRWMHEFASDRALVLEDARASWRAHEDAGAVVVALYELMFVPAC